MSSSLTGRAIGLYVVRFRGTERRRPFNLMPSLIRIVETAIGCSALFRPRGVSEHLQATASVFTGTVGWLQIDVGAADADHFISAEERFHIAMARQ